MITWSYEDKNNFLGIGSFFLLTGALYMGALYMGALYMGALYMGTSKRLKECQIFDDYQEKCIN